MEPLILKQARKNNRFLFTTYKTRDSSRFLQTMCVASIKLKQRELSGLELWLNSHQVDVYIAKCTRLLSIMFYARVGDLCYTKDATLALHTRISV